MVGMTVLGGVATGEPLVPRPRLTPPAVGTTSCTLISIQACMWGPPPWVQTPRGGRRRSLSRSRTCRQCALPTGKRDTGGESLSEMDMETPEDDAAEQARDVTDENGEEVRELPFEVDEADAAEQVRDVGYDDDDYR